MRPLTPKIARDAISGPAKCNRMPASARAGLGRMSIHRPSRSAVGSTAVVPDGTAMPALNSDVLPPASVAVSEELKDPAAGPHVRTEHESELALALAALQRLPEVDRAAMLMRAVDEVPYDEIARALRISL